MDEDDAMQGHRFSGKKSLQLGLLGLVWGVAAFAKGSDAFFETQIRPVLVKHCYDCHATTTSAKGGLTLDTREGLLRGGELGPAIVPGDLEKSLILQAIRYQHEDLAMPPKKSGGKLPNSVIADFERWLLQGAPDPREGSAPAKSVLPAWQDASKRQWWAYQPLKRSALPNSAATSAKSHPIDAWIEAGLKSQGLSPSPAADPATLLRRLCVDLVGLPPTPALLDRYGDTLTQESWEALVDTLLASRHFGERWGRWGLDVARYGESTGKDLNVSFPHAWRYRDYVIQAFQQDKPFDRFIKEQLAGDLLPAANPKEWAEHLIATGFLAVGPKGLSELTPRQYELDLADEMLDATTQAFLGQTLACARCHDHKFDPFTQKDYYAMAGIFLSTEVLYGTLSGPKNNQERELLPLPKEAHLPTTQEALSPEALAELHREYQSAKARYESLMAQRSVGRGSGPSRVPSKPLEFPDLLELDAEMPQREGVRGRSPRSNSPRGKGSAKGGGKGPEFFIQVQVALGKMAELEAKVKAYDAQGQPLAYAMGVKDRPAPSSPLPPMGPTEVITIKGSSGQRPASGFESIADSPWFKRGEMQEPADRVSRGIPQFFQEEKRMSIPPNTSGRLQLAEWIASPQNPLTARVIVNRVWHALFGQGLVRSVDQFGTDGEAPLHPELLDHLALRFIEEGWSVKALIRYIVQGETYQRASISTEEGHRKDPENRYYWRQNVRRLEAESLRDAMLLVSGKLDLNPPVGSLTARLGDGPIGSTGGFIRIQEEALSQAVHFHRSLYLPLARDAVPDALEVFDYPHSNAVQGKREQTHVPTQALYLLNHPFVRELASHFAARLPQEVAEDARLRTAYRLALIRDPSDSELAASKAFLAQEIAAGRSEKDAWSTFGLALLASAEFRFLR